MVLKHDPCGSCLATHEGQLFLCIAVLHILGGIMEKKKKNAMYRRHVCTDCGWKFLITKRACTARCPKCKFSTKVSSLLAAERDQRLREKRLREDMQKTISLEGCESETSK